MSDAPDVPCFFCGDPLSPTATTTFRRVTGWEQNRTDGGTNAIALPKRRGEWACWSCIDRQRKGLDPGQASLL